MADSQQTWPITFQNSLGKWKLPCECLFSFSGSHEIARRKVAKSKYIGTVKERWSQDDWVITISGVLVGTDGQYPREDHEQLLQYLESGLAIQVFCEPFQLKNINYIVIENFDFPHSDGEENQTFQIRCYSDSPVDLLIENVSN